MDKLLAIAGNQYVEFGDLRSLSIFADFFRISPGEETLLESRTVDIEQPD
ncbi:hypothetical protein NKH37_23850 [Mesorhizobium sp. M1217]